MDRCNISNYVFSKQCNKIAKELSGLVFFLVLSFFIAGCGGGSGGSLASSTAEARTADTTRSIIFHNYGNWHLTSEQDHLDSAKCQEELRTLAKSSDICISEGFNAYNAVPGWLGITPQSIKSLNPKARVYEYWSLSTKSEWEGDWGKEGIEPSRKWLMQCPLSWKQINDNNWWLRDGNGNRTAGPDCPDTWLLDVGKPGFKEAYLTGILNRMKDRGYDGVVLDCWWPRFLKECLFDKQGIPMPVDYPTDDIWYEKAWKSFIQYICDGLHQAGYRIIGNSIGEYGSSDATKDFQRSLVDGAIYERFVLDWNGKALSGSEAEKMINAAANDPLDLMILDTGLDGSDPNYDQTQLVSLAAFYIALPMGESPRRSYGNPEQDYPVWQPVWDFNIGSPADPMTKMVGKYFWSRKFTNGIVLLNYGASEDITYTLDRAYKDIDGKVYSGQIVVPSHSAKILAIQAP